MVETLSDHCRSVIYTPAGCHVRVTLHTLSLTTTVYAGQTSSGNQTSQ